MKSERWAEINDALSHKIKLPVGTFSEEAMNALSEETRISVDELREWYDFAKKYENWSGSDDDEDDDDEGEEPFTVVEIFRDEDIDEVVTLEYEW